MDRSGDPYRSVWVVDRTLSPFLDSGTDHRPPTPILSFLTVSLFDGPRCRVSGLAPPVQRPSSNVRVVRGSTSPLVVAGVDGHTRDTRSGPHEDPPVYLGLAHRPPVARDPRRECLWTSSEKGRGCLPPSSAHTGVLVSRVRSEGRYCKFSFTL